MSLFKTLSLLTVVFVLASCGFRPLYGNRDGGTVSAEFAKINIKPIPNRVGQKLRNRLFTHLNPRGRPALPRYDLVVNYNEAIQEFAARKNSFATRANLRLTVTFSLHDARIEGMDPVFSGTAVVTISYNILNSEFATLSAKRNAQERGIREIANEISIRLAAFFKGRRAARATGQ